MPTRRGRKCALLSLAAGLVVLAGSGYVVKDRIAEEYCLWRLERGEQEDKKTAVKRLGMMGSARAASLLVRIVVGDDDDSTDLKETAVVALKTYPCPIPPEAFPPLTEPLTEPELDVWEPALEILRDLGPAAVPGLDLAIQKGNWRARLLATIVLEKLGESGAFPPGLLTAARDRSILVQVAAIRAIERLGTKAMPAVPVLKRVLEEGSWAPRSCARRAYKAILGEDPRAPGKPRSGRTSQTGRTARPKTRPAVAQALPSRPDPPREIEPLSGGEVDAIIERLKTKAGGGRRSRELDALRCLAGQFGTARRWINPTVRPRWYHGEIFRYMFSHCSGARRFMGDAWRMALEEMGCDLDWNEKKRVTGIGAGYMELNRLISRAVYGPPPPRQARPRRPTREEMRKILDEDDFFDDVLSEVRPDLLGSFLRDVWEALDDEDFSKLGAFLKTLHMNVGF